MMKKSFKLTLLFLILISVFLPIATSCSTTTTGARISQKSYTVNVAVNVPSEIRQADDEKLSTLPYSFANKKNSSIQVNVIKARTIVHSRTSDQLSNFTFNLEPGTYTFDVKAFLNNQVRTSFISMVHQRAISIHKTQMLLLTQGLHLGLFI